ncbi:MAG: peptidylprolyl isomerase [Pirellulales bacterium]
MKSIRRSIARSHLLTAICGLGFVLHSHEATLAQQEAPPVKANPADMYKSNSHSDEVDPRMMAIATELQVATHDLKEHMKKMRRLLMQFNLSEGSAQQRQLREDWLSLVIKGRSLHRRFVEETLKEYEAKPDNEGKNAEVLFAVAARNANSDRYDESVDVVRALIKHEFRQKTFELCAALTLAGTGDYEAAKPFAEAARAHLQENVERMLADKAVDKDQKEKVFKQAAELDSLLADLSDIDRQKGLLEAELKAREADAAGEPLPRVLITTTKGEFEIELFENQAPNTVANFISLCEKGFYNRLTFHRVLAHFMAQTGCPEGNGRGGPSYTIAGEHSRPDHRNFFRGTLGMALSTRDPNMAAVDPDSGGSQFFICYTTRSHLNGGYTAFGRVVRNMDLLSDIVHVDPDEKGESESPPDEILSTKVLFKRNHEYKPETIPLTGR